MEPYDVNEETTLIDVATLLVASKAKMWLLTPLLSILTILVWPVVLYWKPRLRRDWLYVRAKSVQEATHVWVESRGKCLACIFKRAAD